MKILHEVCSLPTAPFSEQYVVRYIERFVKARPTLKLSRDRYGNLLIELRAKSANRSTESAPRWVFTAHMDHPGFVARRMLDANTLEADFRGWVQIDYVRKEKVRFFSGQSEISGTVIEATADEYERLTVPNRVKVRVKSPVAPGSPGMFEQGEGRVKGSKFYSRAIDDLGGLSACLAMLNQLTKRPPKVPVAVLLTRAEEEGFIGAIAAVLHPQLLKKTDRVIAIETSAMQPYAPQGKGVIIRIGDKTSVFNSDLSYFITHQAEQLAKRDKSFHYQRALMPGGTCEATVYDIYGYTAAAICVALGNYHNMDREKKKIGPEYIDVNDWKNMVELFVEIARTGHEYQPGHKLLKARVEKRFTKLKRFLKSS
jgi:putative aminopeptidase FrvX